MASPDTANFHGYLGSTLKELGRPEDAVASYEAALAIDSSLAEAHYNIGNVLKDQGHLEDAAERYRNALAINPANAEARNNLGTVLSDLGHLEDAADCFEAVLQDRPDLAEVHFNLGNVHLRLARPEAAAESYRKAVEINPEYTDAHANMGNALKDQGRLDDAEGSYKKALAVDGACIEALNNLGAVHKEQGRWDDSVDCYQRVLEIDPDFSEALFNLGGVYGDLGQTDDAAECFHRAGKNIEDATRAEIKAALLLPPILSSVEEIGPLRQALADKVNAISDVEDGEADLQDPHKAIGKTGFFLAYHGQNDRDLQKAIAAMYLRVWPSLAYEAFEHPVSHAPSEGGKIRLGVVSMHLHSHTIGKINLGILENLDREKFEVTVFRPQQKHDDLSQTIDNAVDKVIFLSLDLDRARLRIAEETIDVLFYPDIGMEPFTYFLSFSRLAPVQLVGWGHPVTTGIPAIDYFLSSEDMEVPEADDHYSERLIRLPHLPAFYKRPPTVSPADRAHFELPEDGRLYVIPQTLFKFHPDFDPVLGNILRQDPDGHLVLISGNRESWNELLRERFQATFPDQADRVIFIPRMNSADFVRLMGIADALLDTSHFCGGFSSTEAFAAGHPIVTWPGTFMRGRVTYAQYKAMGISELIAEDGESYVALALRLAQDLEFREEMKNRVAENSTVLFENFEAVRELERFFTAALDAARGGQALKDW